jgi:hypothetical protein
MAKSSAYDDTDCIVVHLDRMLAKDPAKDDSFWTVEYRSTSKVFKASVYLADMLAAEATGFPQSLGKLLVPSLFKFKEKNASHSSEGIDQLRANLAPYMPLIVCSEDPLLEAAKVNTMKEFDRAYRSILRSDCFRGRNLLMVSGLNIDLNSTRDHKTLFPGTSFIPFAAYHQQAGRNGGHDVGFVIEQDRLFERLMQQSGTNEHELNLDAQIETNKNQEEVMITRRGVVVDNNSRSSTSSSTCTE